MKKKGISKSNKTKSVYKYSLSPVKITSYVFNMEVAVILTLQAPTEKKVTQLFYSNATNKSSRGDPIKSLSHAFTFTQIKSRFKKKKTLCNENSLIEWFKFLSFPHYAKCVYLFLNWIIFKCAP